MLVHKCNFLLQLLLKISANFYDFMPTNAYRSYQLLLCNKRQRQARNQWGNLAFANPKFSKTYSVVRYNSNLQSFYPLPKISAGCGPGHRFLVWKNRMVSPQSQHSSESDVACGRITTKSHKIHFFNTPLFEQLACSCQVECII